MLQNTGLSAKCKPKKLFNKPSLKPNLTFTFLSKTAPPEQAKNGTGYKESGIGPAGFFCNRSSFLTVHELTP